MRLTYNAQKFMAAIAAIAMFCFGPAMAAGTGLEKVYQACPGNKFAGDEIGKDKSKCYEKVTIYDVRVACSNNLQKAGDGVSPVYKDVACASGLTSSSICKYDGVKASKDRCYNISNDRYYATSKNGDDPSTSESATCRDDFSKQTSGTFYKSETDSVTAKSDRPYCTNPTSGYFYGNPSDRPYIEYYNGCYAIGSASQLYGFADAVNNMTEGEICGTLVENIVVNENVLNTNGALNGDGSSFTPWTPIKVMSGKKVTLNGNGKTISGLYFNNERNGYVGLFGEVKGTVSISELGIKDSYFNGFYYVGGLVGNNNVGGTLSVTNSYNAGTVTGKNNVGGLVGSSSATLTITNCYNVGTVSGDYYVGGFVGKNYDATLTITNSFFLGEGNNYGGTGKSADEFANGTVARLLHNYVQTGCKENCIDGTIWGQDVLNGDLLPNFSDKITGTLYDLVLHTFDDDNRSYPTYYLSEKGLELPTDLTRKNYVFLGWSAKETPGSSADIVTSIAKGETGTKMFYAQWMKVNEKGCYEIGTAFELYAFANVVNNATDGSQICGKLTKDIVVNTGVLDKDGALNGAGSGFTPWNPMKVVSGVKVTLDGNGKTISGLYFNNENTNYVGLFGDVLGTVSIRNLGVKDSYFKGRNNVGGFVGYSKGTLTIANSYNSGTVSGSGDNVGGLVGYNFGANAKLTIENSYNAGPVSGINKVGGLVGDNNDGGSLSIENSYNSGTVNGHNNVGGLVGYNVDENAKLTIMTITNSYNSGAVSGSGHYVGGLVGMNHKSATLTITNSYNAGAVSGSGYNVGGLVGDNNDGGSLSIENSYNSGTVNGHNNVGGLVGENDGTLTITNSYNAGAVSGSKDKVGGLVGDNVGENAKLTITNSFFLETRKSGDGLGGEAKTLDDFHNGTVAFLLHNWCEMDGDNCKVGGLDGFVWGQDFTKENSLPDLSGKFVGRTPHTLTLHTFKGDTSKLPIIYLEGSGLKLPTDLTRKNYVFLGWSAKETAESFADIVTSIANDETGAKEFYAQWKELNADGCFEIASTVELYGFANVVNNATEGEVCGTLVDNIVVNMGVLNDGTLNGVGSSFTPWTPMNVKSSVQVTLNGNGHTISGLYFNEESVNDVGLFGYVWGELSISNLGIEDSYFRGRNYVGGFVGMNYESATLTITNSYNSGTVSGNDYFVGGFVGMNYESATLTITNSYNAGAVTGKGGVGGLVGMNYEGATLTITNSFFLGEGDNYGGTGKSAEEFHNGTVAFLLHNWCEMDGDNCKVGGLDGSVWGQDFKKENSLPDLSGKFVGGTPHTLTLHTFEGDTSKLPIIYLEDKGLVLPTDLTRKNYVFLGWSAKETAESFADIVTSIAQDATGAKEFYAQWKELNAAGCFEISSTLELFAFANVVKNATDGSQICGKLTTDIVVNTGVLNDGTLNGDSSSFTPWTPMNILSDAQVTLNGAGKTISGLYFNDEDKYYVGLFGDVKGALSISNLGVKDSYFKGYFNVGGLVGYNNGGTLTIENSYNSGTVNGSVDYVGGLVGYSYNGTLTITNSYNEGSVSGDYFVGGLVGDSDYGTLTITNSYNAGTVSGTERYVGGLVGSNGGENAKLTITNSYNAGTVSGDYFVGGLVGDNYSAILTIENSYNVGAVSGNDYVGGLVGVNEDGTLNVSSSFFLAAEGVSDELGGTPKSADEFADGTVALLLHDWCEKEDGSDECKVDGLNGTIWGQNVGQASDNDAAPTLSGVLKFGPLTIAKNAAGKDSAAIDGASELEMKIPAVLNVPSVTFKRTFAGSGYSTIMLPFTPNCTDDDCVEGVKFFEFNSYTDGEVQATEVSPKDLKADTPYLVQAAGATELVFKNGGTFNTTTGEAYNSETGEYKVALTGDGAGWTIYGTYEYKTWEEGDAGLGRTYGFAANDGVNDPSIVGKFAKIAAGAYIYPMRAYLEYTAPAALARPAANGEIRTVASLPDEIDVVIVDKDEKTGEQTTRVIGTINTRTGEFKFANDRWFDLQGRYLGVKKPTQKGAYYNNGKKVIVK